MIIAIDGASRRNGKPDCRAAGSIFYRSDDKVYGNGAVDKTPATNQQGEILGLMTALTYAVEHLQDETVYLITDSEYVFNAVTKDWITSWHHKGWVNKEGEPIKAKELWQNVAELQLACLSKNIEVMPYHIKGHLVSIGKVTAAKLLAQDPTGEALAQMAWTKYPQAEAKKPEKFAEARELFKRNNGFIIEEDMFRRFVVFNTVADYVAGTHLDEVELESSHQ